MIDYKSASFLINPGVANSLQFFDEAIDQKTIQ